MNQLSKLWISISIALSIAQISQASNLVKTILPSGQQARKLSVFHDTICKHAKVHAKKIGVPDQNNQTYHAVLKTKQEFDATNVISQLQAFVYWQKLLEHKQYKLAALGAQHPTSKIFINCSPIDPQHCDGRNLQSITIVQDEKQRILAINVATMSTEHGKILIEENNQETEFKK